MRARISALTHRGLVRDHNEDCLGWNGWAMSGPAPAVLTIDLEVTSPMIVAVCDGMGGHAGGAAASRQAVESLTRSDNFTDCTTLDECLAPARQLLQRTSDRLNDIGAADPMLGGMGCTAVGVVLLPDARALVFNVGDSRCYRLEDEFLAQLTEDHRVAGTHTLTQALGGGRRILLEPHFFECDLPAAPGLLLSTDGLDDYAAAAAIESAMTTPGADLTRRLRDTAFRGGAGDNITLVQIQRLPTEVNNG